MSTAPDNLFSPLQQRSITLPNRIVVSPMCQFSSVGGVAVDRAELAHGRDDDAVGKGDAALLERREEVVGCRRHGELDVAAGREDAVGGECIVRGWGASNRMMNAVTT